MTTQTTHQHKVGLDAGEMNAAARACRAAVIVVAMIAAVVLMTGESWVLENAPAASVACAIGQASDLARALHSGVATATAAVDESAE